MSNPIDDKAFEEYLSGRGDLSRRYRELDATDVPAHLDDAVLAQARAAVKDNEQSAATDQLARVRERRRRLTRWAIPTTLAACSLLVVSIVIRSGNQHEVMATQMASQAPAAAPEPMASPVAPAAKMEDKASADQEELVLIAPPRNAVTEFSSLAPSPEVAAARAERSRKQAQSGKLAGGTEQTRQQLLRSELQLAPPPPIESTTQAAPASVPFAAAPAAMPAEKELEEEVQVASSSVPSTSESSEARSQSSDDADLSEIAVTGMRKAAAPRMSGPRNTVANAGRADASVDSSTPDQYATPEDWLIHIRELRRDGHTADADREWQDFRKQYPDYAVPDTDLAKGGARH